jgi:hypothetical protein
MAEHTHDRTGLSGLTILQIVVAVALLVLSLYQWMR